MIAAINIDPGYLTQTRDLTRYKKILFYAKIDGVNWYDLSDYVLKVRTNNRIELLETPAIDSAVVTVRNENNAFTPTQYNDIFDPDAGKINGTIEQNYLNKTWEVKLLVEVDNGTTTTQVPIFYGWKPANAITERHKTADIELKDLLWITTQKKPDNPLLYTNYTPDQIISDILINRIGLDASYLDLQALTTPWEVFVADDMKTWWQILQEIAQATGGKLTCTPDSKIAFRTRIENYSDPTPAITITEDNIKNYNINTKRQFNQIKIQSQGYEIGTAQEYVIDHELQGDANIIKAGTQGTFELEYTSEYIKDPDTYVYISYYLNDTPIAVDRQFSAGYDDGNIRLDELTAYPDKLILKITNLSSTVDYRIKHIKFSAIPVKKKSELTVTKPNQTGQPDAELSLTSYYSSEALLSNIADALYGETTKTIKFTLQLNEFYPELFAGNLISLQLAPKGISSGTFLINGVEHELEAQKFRTSISITEWGNVIFDIADKQIVKSTPSEVVQQPSEQTQLETVQQQVQELQTQVQTVDNRTDFIDGAAPATPTGLALATINNNGLSFITASWNANTESDLIGYELAWSYDGIDWNYIKTSETLVKFEVAGNMTIYVKVRAYDAEGKKSGWSTVQSITSAKDTTPPAIPTGLTATGLFQTIMVKWNKNTETDFDHYVLEYDTSDTFPAPKQIVTSSNYATLKELTVNTTYYIRIKAVDKSGNESDWSTTVSVSTVKIDDENYYDYAAIKDAIIHNGYIDSAWISELDAGLIKSGYIDADRIQARSITSGKLVVQPANALPEGTIAYWTDSLIDVVNGIVPDGFTEINLAPSITLTPYNAPEGSVVGDLLAGNKIYAGKSIQVGNKVFIENTSSDKGQIRVNSGGVDIVKIGEASTPKYYETCEIYVDVLGGLEFPMPKVYASLDGVTWIEIGSTQNLNKQMTKVGLFSLQKEGTTLYLKVKTIGSGGAEDGDIVLYVDGSLAYTFHYSVEVGVTEEQIFSYTLPSSPSDGISISGGLLETPQIVLSNAAGKILFTDSYWEITDGQVIFDYFTELTMEFTNKYFNDKIIFFALDYYDGAIRGFGLRFDSGGGTFAQIFNNDGELIIGKYDKRTGYGPYIRLRSNSHVEISGEGLELPSLLTAPIPIAGMIYFNSTDKHFYGHNGSVWVRLD